MKIMYDKDGNLIGYFLEPLSEEEIEQLLKGKWKFGLRYRLRRFFAAVQKGVRSAKQNVH